MKKIQLIVASLGIAVSAVPAAIAAPAPYQAGWQSISAREGALSARIDQGVRSGALSRSEARSLRAELRSIERREDAYRRSRPGLTPAERRDLDRRFDRLAARVHFEKHDGDYRRR